MRVRSVPNSSSLLLLLPHTVPLLQHASFPGNTVFHKLLQSGSFQGLQRNESTLASPAPPPSTSSLTLLFIISHMFFFVLVHFSFPQLLCSLFYPFLNIFPQRCHHLGWGTQPLQMASSALKCVKMWGFISCSNLETWLQGIAWQAKATF